MGTVVRVLVEEPSQVGAARRATAHLGRRLGLSDETLGRLALVVTELANNLVKHAPLGGEVIAASHPWPGAPVLDLHVLDHGPGTDRVGVWLRDGYSTAGSMGTGLGAALRLSSIFEIHSAQDRGTVVFARFSEADRDPPLAAGGVASPARGEDVCGDAWSVRYDPGSVSVIVADGIGHGEAAAEAADEAIGAFQRLAPAEPGAMLQSIHGELRSTRGAAAAVARVDLKASVLTYAGIGNIAAVIVQGSRAKSLASMNGTLGHGLRAIRQFDYPWEPDASLVMHSDGIRSRWSLDAYPGLARRHPSLVAGVLYRDLSRSRDDATVVVTRRLESDPADA